LNTDKSIVIIGCGAGGGTAAQFARKTDRKAKITIIEKGKYPQYSKCGIPYTISGAIPNVMDLVEFSEDWFKKNNIDLLLEATVEKIDTKKQVIYAKNGDKKTEQSYNKLIICTGAESFIPPIKNIKKETGLVDGVFTVRTIDDAKQISKHIIKGKNAVIIGVGLIGLEMADNLFKKQMKVTIVEALPSILANNLDNDMAKLVAEHIPKEINIYTNHIVTIIETSNDKISKVLIKNNETGEEKKLDTDLMIIATGTRPNVELAKNIGCKIGETGGIIVNNRSETSVKNVYAAGDCTQYIDYITAKPTLIGLGSIVVRQAISAGVNVAGGNYELLKGVLSTSTSEFFGLEIASVGPITSRAEKDFSVITGSFNGFSLPHYYPGGKPVSVKVLVDEYTGMIMGAQCVGDKAAQRINTFACAILGRLDIETFRKLETAYAPPIAPTLDAVTLACDVVSMKLDHKKR